MSYQTLLFDIHNGIAFITINRPDKLNALNDQVMLELGQVADRLATEAEIKGAIFTGSGPKAFVAGADIGDLSKQGPFDGKARAQRGQSVLRRIETCGKPVIACINGFALGGGCELAMACPLRLANPAARLGQPEIKLGLIPGYGGTQRLPRLVGRGAALKLLLTAAIIDASEALRIGLVDELIDGDIDQLMARAQDFATLIAGMPPLAVRAMIDAVDRGADLPLDEALALEASIFGRLFATEDKREGTRAFLEKRAPKWTGR